MKRTEVTPPPPLTIDHAAVLIGHNRFGSRSVAKKIARDWGLANNAREFDELCQRIAHEFGEQRVLDHIREGFRTVWVRYTDPPYTIDAAPDEQPGEPNCHRISAMTPVASLSQEIDRVLAIAQANMQRRKG